MNVWVEMAKGVSHGAARWQQRVDALATLVRDGHVRIVISPGLYLELWHRGTQKSRDDVGRLVRDLSDYATFAPLTAIRKREVEAYVRRHIGASSWVTADDVLGEGACFAFGSRFGRFRFVEYLAAEDGSVPEGRAVAAPDEWLKTDWRGPQWEWLNLVGTAEIVESPGIERRPQHRIGDEWVHREQALRHLVLQYPEARRRLRDLIVVDEVQDLTTAINQACWDARVQPHGLFMENPGFDSPASGMRAFVSGLPSVDALTTFREWKHRDLNHSWDQHDHTDLVNLSMAVPYADVIVTERRWAHLAHASGLVNRYGSVVVGIRHLDEVIYWLSRRTQASYGISVRP